MKIFILSGGEYFDYLDIVFFGKTCYTDDEIKEIIYEETKIYRYKKPSGRL